MYQTILTHTEQGICTITINRPDKMNALNKDVIQELGAALDAALIDTAVQALIITGAGEKAFVAGADITEFTAAIVIIEGAECPPHKGLIISDVKINPVARS